MTHESWLLLCIHFNRWIDDKIIDESINYLIDSSINRFSSRRLIAGVHRLIAAALMCIFIIINEYQRCYRLPGRRQGRCHVSYGVHSWHSVTCVAIRSSIQLRLQRFGTEAEMVMTLWTAVDRSKPLQQRQRRPYLWWCCASTVKLPVAQLTQNATDYVNWCRPRAVTRQRDTVAHSGNSRWGQWNGILSAAWLEASGDHGEVETRVHFSGPSRRVTLV